MERKKRYTPDPASKDTTRRPTRATLDVLEAIYEQEFIRSTYLDIILPHRNANGLRQTLARLHVAGLVAKVIDHSQSLYCPDIYYLTTAGENFLKDFRVPKKFVNTYRPRQDYRIEFQHKMGISDTIANIRAGAIANGCKIISQTDIQKRADLDEVAPLKLPVSVSTDINGYQRSWSGNIEPDGLFGIEYPDGKVSYIALEYQNTGKVRANKLLGVSSVRRKFLSYVDAYKNKTFKKWGITNLRVLFVFAQESDCQQSILLGDQMYPDGNPMFLIKHIPNHRETKSGMLVAPLPYPELFTDPLVRINKDEIELYKKEALTEVRA